MKCDSLNRDIHFNTYLTQRNRWFCPRPTLILLALLPVVIFEVAGTAVLCGANLADYVFCNDSGFNSSSVGTFKEEVDSIYQQFRKSN